VSEIDTDVLVVGSGAGGATTAAVLAEAGRDVTIVEEGPDVPPGTVEPFSLDEMVLKYRHRGTCAALGAPPIAYVEGRCVGGSTEINSGLWHRLPDDLAAGWRREYEIAEFGDDVLARYAAQAEGWMSVSRVPGAPPPSSAVLEDGASKLGWRSVEFPRVFRYEADGRAVKQTMTRTLIPRALRAGARLIADCRVERLTFAGSRVTGARCRRDGERVTVRADHVFVCGGAIQTPALLQRSGRRKGIGTGLKVHPTIKIAARFANALDHGDVPMHRVTEFSPAIEIGGSAARRGHVALALADSGAEFGDALADWENVSVYYACIKGDAGGRVVAVPGLASPIVTYRLTDADLSQLARGLVHLGEVLFAAGAIELYPSVTGAAVARTPADMAGWWNAVDRKRSSLMTVHLTSTVRLGENRRRAAADSFGRLHGTDTLYVNDASLLPAAPGVNPQATIMTIAARNADHFLNA